MNFLNKMQTGLKSFQEGAYQQKKEVFSALKSQQDPKVCLVTCAGFENLPAYSDEY